jgi:Raf kinase inhibitor-like YbhB/YbcL family protein
MMQKATFVAAFLMAFAAIGSLSAGVTRMKITSSAFQEDGNIPSKFTCDGADTSPPLHIEGVSEGAKSLVLIVDDPDAPVGLFTHWIAWNIDPKSSEVAEGNPPAKAVQGKNDFGKSGYGGPCPPGGTHRYFFRIYALDRELDLAAGSKRKQLENAMRGHVVGEGQLMGKYSRRK